MDEDAPHTMRWPRVFARVAGYMILGVGLYVLSVGPAYYLFAYRSPTVDGMVGQFYAPLSWMAERTNLSEPISRYCLWWLYLPGGGAERMVRKARTLPASQDPLPAKRIPAPERAP